MVSQQPPTEVGSEGVEAITRMAQLEAEIAQLKDALVRRQQIGVATGLLAQRFGISPERAWALLVRLSQNGHVKVRDIAQTLIDAHCGQLSQAEAELLSSIERYLPDGVRLVQSQGDGHRDIRERPS